MTNPWIILVLAGLFEVVWAVAMKASDGFSRPAWSVLTGVAAVISFWLLAIAMKHLPLGTAYTAWVGIGAVGAAVLGIIAFGDSVTPLRIGGIVLIMLGVLALKLA
jgi:quaternary ammonium compound-resistance protein SugE